MVFKYLILYSKKYNCSERFCFSSWSQKIKWPYFLLAKLGPNRKKTIFHFLHQNVSCLGTSQQWQHNCWFWVIAGGFNPFVLFPTNLWCLVWVPSQKILSHVVWLQCETIFFVEYPWLGPISTIFPLLFNPVTCTGLNNQFVTSMTKDVLQREGKRTKKKVVFKQNSTQRGRTMPTRTGKGQHQNRKEKKVIYLL